MAEGEGPFGGPGDAPASLTPDDAGPRGRAGRLSPARSGMAEACDLEGSDKLGSSDEGSTICVVDWIEGAVGDEAHLGSERNGWNVKWMDGGMKGREEGGE